MFLLLTIHFSNGPTGVHCSTSSIFLHVAASFFLAFSPQPSTAIKQLSIPFKPSFPDLSHNLLKHKPTKLALSPCEWVRLVCQSFSSSNKKRQKGRWTESPYNTMALLLASKVLKKCVYSFTLSSFILNDIFSLFIHCLTAQIPQSVLQRLTSRPEQVDGAHP